MELDFDFAFEPFQNKSAAAGGSPFEDPCGEASTSATSLETFEAVEFGEQ